MGAYFDAISRIPAYLRDKAYSMTSDISPSTRQAFLKGAADTVSNLGHAVTHVYPDNPFFSAIANGAASFARNLLTGPVSSGSNKVAYPVYYPQGLSRIRRLRSQHKSHSRKIYRTSKSISQYQRRMKSNIHKYKRYRSNLLNSAFRSTRI